MLKTQSYTVTEGSPNPRGATWDGRGTNFSLFSENATEVELCLFDDAGTTELERISLPEFTDGIWHGHVEALPPGTVYGYRVHGPYEPNAGHRFNANKLLLDPYATTHIGELKWGAPIFGYIMETGDDTTFDTRDSASSMPKCIVTDPDFAWHDGQQPRKKACRVPWDETILYELHAKGYTKLHPDVPERLRGTYAGLGEQPVVDYIKSLGVTSIELLPIHTFVDESHLHDLHLTNYWGYNTIGFFAPDPRYAAEPKHALREFKQMVARYHDAGLEVVLDVVYNHTAEGNERGPTLSFKGIDNASYYRLHDEDRRYYVNDTGTGNTVNVAHPRVLQMVADSLRYWVEEAHVDGFRFDLGTILAREQNGFDTESAFLKVVGQDPVLSRVKLIAEPWDIGPGGYRVGEFPGGWMEWNDTFRDRSRGFWIGRSTPADLAKAMTGSPEIFNHGGRRPWTSVNFVTAHDGFTLGDLVSYNDKHNLANGEDNRDGSNDNRSYNCGAEGVSTNERVLALRDLQMRNLLSTLFLSQGTPMLLAGDEFARTQNGNNNAYCQDNEISWVDWKLRETHSDILKFTQHLIALRRKFPLLHQSRYLDSEAGSGTQQLTWLLPDGPTTQPASWTVDTPHCFGMWMQDVQRGSSKRQLQPALLIVVNDDHDFCSFKLPAGKWSLLIDTDNPEDSAELEATCHVNPQSLLVLVEAGS